MVDVALVIFVIINLLYPRIMLTQYDVSYGRIKFYRDCFYITRFEIHL